MFMIFLLKIQLVTFLQLLNLVQHLIESVFIFPTQDERHLTFTSFYLC